MGPARRLCVPFPISLFVILFLFSVCASAADPYNREICYQKVKGMLENGTIANNDTIFHRNRDGVPMSEPDHPVLNLHGCYEMCGADFGWYLDIGPRLSTWLIPIFVLLSNMEVSPLDKRRYLMLLHLLADPIDSLWSLLSKLEAWSRCHHLARSLCRRSNEIKIRYIATVLGALEELVGFHDNPATVFTAIKDKSTLEKTDFDRLVSHAAQQLADSRTDERLRTMLATALYIYQLVSAFVSTVGGGNTSPPGGRIGITMFLTWIIPSILLSNAIGGFTSRRICYSILESFVQQVTGDQDAWYVLQRASPSLRQYETVHDYMDTMAWSGAIYSYRPSKSLVYSAGKRDVSSFSLLVLAVIPVFTSSIIASVLLWNTPPIGINCRNVLIFVMTAVAILSTIITRISARFFTGSCHWHIMLVKDAIIAIPSVILVFLACAGRFNSCWCWSGVFSLGANAHIPLNAAPEFAAYNKTTYPTLVGACITIQVLAFMSMMWVGWRGWNVMRWGEEEKKVAWRNYRTNVAVINVTISAK